MEKRYAAVVGAVNVDIWGRSFAPLIARDSNPGELRLYPGGVGRNIAHNLTLLGERVELLTVLGGDVWAEHIEDSCRALGIGLSRALRLSDERTSSYMYITGPDGDMALAVCDMDIARHMTPEVIEANLDMLNSAALVVFDGNLTAETIGAICERVTAPLFADPVSVTKAKKLIPHLVRLHTVKPNAMEAEALTGEADPLAAAEALVKLGVNNAFVTDGGRGIAAASAEGAYFLPASPARLINATGGGDAAMAALSKSFLCGYDIPFAARYALAAGAIAVECGETINPALSDAAVLNRM